MCSEITFLLSLDHEFIQKKCIHFHLITSVKKKKKQAKSNQNESWAICEI